MLIIIIIVIVIIIIMMGVRIFEPNLNRPKI